LGSRPSFIEEEYVSAARFPGLWEHDIAQPVLLLFERVYGVVPVRDRIVIRQSQFSPETSKILEIEEPAIGMVLEQTVFDEDDRPISFGCQYWRGDVARFSADIRY
jgi:GntR family transcriptional regulator